MYDMDDFHKRLIIARSLDTKIMWEWMNQFEDTSLGLITFLLTTGRKYIEVEGKRFITQSMRR